MEDRAQWEVTPQAHPTFAKSQKQDRQGSQDENFPLEREESGLINKEPTQMFFIKSARDHAHITDFQIFSFRAPTPQVEKS